MPLVFVNTQLNPDLVACMPNLCAGKDIREKNGWFYVNMPNFFCGGFAYLAPTNGTR